MPYIDLNTPTQLFLEWGWVLVTRANGIVFVLLVLVLLLGASVGLPEGASRRPRRRSGVPTTADGEVAQ
jgi:hypothetical protein